MYLRSKIHFFYPPVCHTKEAKIQKRLNSKIVMPGPPKVNIRRGARRAQRQANRAQRWAQRAQQLAPRAQQWAPRAQWLAQWAQSGHRAGTERERGEAWFSNPPRSTRKCQLWTPKGAQTMSFRTLREVPWAPCSPLFTASRPPKYNKNSCSLGTRGSLVFTPPKEHEKMPALDTKGSPNNVLLHTSGGA